ncbi:MAG TPA: tetratricopeptide repeat protein [Bacteroidia bacterium]|jgi:Ca-activated chloride channel family protein|nr:tetratricopeptide repeat protein [Bacteroidia bacterium]
MKQFFYILSALILNSYTAFSQQERYILREGNNQYNSGRYKKAEQYYGDALKKKNNYFKANYNLGNALYKQGKFKDALEQYDVFIKNNADKDTLSKAFHNIGNSYLKEKRYEDAIKAYKNSLKFNPKDENTRYNLAYAKKKLEEQQKKDGGKDNKENKDKKDDKKNKDKKDQQNKDNKDKKDQKEQPKMSKEEAQRMLEALKNAEQKLQEFHKKKGDKKTDSKNIDKDW